VTELRLCHPSHPSLFSLFFLSFHLLVSQSVTTVIDMEEAMLVWKRSTAGFNLVCHGLGMNRNQRTLCLVLLTLADSMCMLSEIIGAVILA